MKENASRRAFLGGSAGLAATGLAAAVANPIGAAAQAVDVKPADLPNLMIKEVKVYVTDISKVHKLNSPETGELLSVVTEGGIEGNYTIGDRNATPGWLDWAKTALVGKSVMDLLPTLTSTSGMKAPGGFDGGGPARRRGRAGGREREPGPAEDEAAGSTARRALARWAVWGRTRRLRARRSRGRGSMTRGGGTWPNYYTAAADVCLWDILGKAVNKPIYKILSGGTPTKDRMMAYASSQHLPAIEDYVPDVTKAKAMGFKAYKIHPGNGQHATGPAIPTYIGHIEEIKQVRAAVGDEFVLMHDPVQRYNRFEAMTVGRVLDDLNYAWFEDPVRTTDMEGLIELCKELNLPIHVGEFIYSIADFADYIKYEALDVVRLIADNVGGISGAMRVGLLADAHGLECTPHNWGNVPDMALHFNVELALPNSWWFEMPFPPEYADRPEYKDTFRPNAEGYVMAPTEPGLGYPIDHDALDKVTLKINR
jgi:L-alanine-DL-glutamate epimerase-like enolase superfamily enzyme